MQVNVIDAKASKAAGRAGVKVKVPAGDGVVDVGDVRVRDENAAAN